MTLIPQQPPDEFGPVEHLISDQLVATLEPQRGKALAAFRQHVAAQKAGESEGSGPAPIPISRGARGTGRSFGRREIPRNALWYWAGVPSLVAAGLAVVVTLQLTAPQKRVTPTDGSAMASGKVTRMEEISRDVPGEVTVLADGTPVREIHRQTTRQTQWEDARDHATYSVTEQPVDTVNYVQVQPF